MILDLSGVKEAGLAEAFCLEITNGPYCGLPFTFDGLSPAPRLILRGDPAQILTLLQDRTVHFPESSPGAQRGTAFGMFRRLCLAFWFIPFQLRRKTS